MFRSIKKAYSTAKPENTVKRDMRWMRTQLFVAVVLTFVAGTISPALAKSQRIVSMNLCTDQLVMLLADPENIASVSYLALDPEASALAEEAARFQTNYGLTEEILPLEPDLVLAGSFTTRPTVFLLRKLGYPVVEIPPASSLNDIHVNIRAIAAAVGEPERGEAMIAAMERKLPSQAAFLEKPQPLAVLYWLNGYSSGKGTLANAAVEAAGYRTLGNELGFSGTAQLPLETLLAADPDVLVVGQELRGAAMAKEILRHPALKKAFTKRSRVSVPDYLWVCGTPFVADAIVHLAAARNETRKGAEK